MDMQTKDKMPSNSRNLSTSASLDRKIEEMEKEIRMLKCMIKERDEMIAALKKENQLALAARDQWVSTAFKLSSRIREDSSNQVNSAIGGEGSRIQKRMGNFENDLEKVIPSLPKEIDDLVESDEEVKKLIRTKKSRGDQEMIEIRSLESTPKKRKSNENE